MSSQFLCFMIIDSLNSRLPIPQFYGITVLRFERNVHENAKRPYKVKKGFLEIGLRWFDKTSFVPYSLFNFKIALLAENCEITSKILEYWSDEIKVCCTRPIQVHFLSMVEMRLPRLASLGNRSFSKCWTNRITVCKCNIDCLICKWS